MKQKYIINYHDICVPIYSRVYVGKAGMDYEELATFEPICEFSTEEIDSYYTIVEDLDDGTLRDTITGIIFRRDGILTLASPKSEYNLVDKDFYNVPLEVIRFRRMTPKVLLSLGKTKANAEKIRIILEQMQDAAQNAIEEYQKNPLGFYYQNYPEYNVSGVQGNDESEHDSSQSTSQRINTDGTKDEIFEKINEEGIKSQIESETKGRTR